MTGSMVRPARAEDESALAALWATAFSPALAPDQWLRDADRLVHTIVAEDAAGVCGSVYGLPKRLRESDGGFAEVHAIGSVAVAERARRQGLARRLVAATLEAGRDADWALLFTGTPEVYRSSGFETFSMDRTLAGAWQAPASARAGGDVARETIGVGSLGAVHEAYELSRDGRVVLAPVRDDRDWAMAEVRMGGATLYRSTEGSAVRGYAIAEQRDGVGAVLETAVLPDAVDATAVRRDLFAAIATDWASAEVTSCELAIPALPEEERAVQAFAPEVVRREDRTGMIRPLRREARLHGIRHFTAADYF